MVATFPHPNTVPIIIPSTSPMEHPVRQCSVAENAILLSELLWVAISVLPVRVYDIIVYPWGVYVKKAVDTAIVHVPIA